MRDDEVWKDGALVDRYLREVTGGVPLGADQLAVMVRVAAASGRPVRRILDVGAGSGVATLALLARWPGAEATLVEFSDAMLAAARRALAGVEPAPRLVAADLADPRWVEAVRARAPFDAVVSRYAIHHLDDARKRALYAELFDLVAPGGVFVNVEHVASRGAWGAALSDEAMVDALHAHAASTGAGPGPTRGEVAARFAARPDRAANILAPLETQCEWLRAIGYADVDCFFKVFELAVFGGRRPVREP